VIPRAYTKPPAGRVPALTSKEKGARHERAPWGELKDLAGQWSLGVDFLTRHGHMSWLTRGIAQHAAYTACEHEWRRVEHGMYGQRGTCVTSAGMTSDSTPVIKTTTIFYPLSKGP
jgi:hypothetical protein